MIQILVFALILIFPYDSYADWTSQLQAIFPSAYVIETFDNVNDWHGSVVSDPTTSGLPSGTAIDEYTVGYTGTTTHNWIQDHGGNYTGPKGAKSLCFGLNDLYGSTSSLTKDAHCLGQASWYFGDGSVSSGTDDLYIFYRVKLRDPEEVTINLSTYKWTPCEHANCYPNTYYLENQDGSNNVNIVKPTSVKVDSSWLIRSTAPVAGQSYKGDSSVATWPGCIPTLNAGTWSYAKDPENGNNITLYVRLSDGGNPSDHTIKTWLWGLSILNMDSMTWLSQGSVKIMDVMAGFRAVNRWGTEEDYAITKTTIRDGYGCNFTIFDWTTTNSYQTVGMFEQSNTAFWDGGNNYYNYTYSGLGGTSGVILYPYTGNPGQNYGLSSTTGIDFGNWWYDNPTRWLSFEYHLKLGTSGSITGTLTEVWVYDDRGVLLTKGYAKIQDGEMHLNNFPSHKYNKVVLGGNRYGEAADTLNDSADPSLWQYFVDDLIIQDGNSLTCTPSSSGGCIGPRYFGAANAKNHGSPKSMMSRPPS